MFLISPRSACRIFRARVGGSTTSGELFVALAPRVRRRARDGLRPRPTPTAPCWHERSRRQTFAHLRGARRGEPGRPARCGQAARSRARRRRCPPISRRDPVGYERAQARLAASREMKPFVHQRRPRICRKRHSLAPPRDVNVRGGEGLLRAVFTPAYLAVQRPRHQRHRARLRMTRLQSQRFRSARAWMPMVRPDAASSRVIFTLWMYRRLPVTSTCPGARMAPENWRCRASRRR